MKEQIKIYNSEGRVEDPEIARKMAKTEDPFREKASKRFLGIGANKIIKKGEVAGEKAGEQLFKRMNDPIEISFKKMKENAKNRTTEELEADLDYSSGRAPHAQVAIELEIERRKMVDILGSLLHNEWRASRMKEDGTFESRLKKTKDNTWIKKYGTDNVDIANTDFDNLPEDWKGENKISADIAMDEIFKAKAEGDIFDRDFIEYTSAIIHTKWLERNSGWASEEQKKPYSDLSEEEKEKDRAIVRKAIEVYQNSIK
ncbi:MAG: hypothetical protein WC662_01940 [Candidatus Paceibacterota bacterium]|jgi:hypothetical protein